MKKFKFLIIAIFIIAIVFVYHNVLASTATWHGTVGGVSITAEKDVWLTQDIWYTELYSMAAQWINIIGYTYWTIGEYCPSSMTWASWEQFSGDYDTYDSYYYSSASMYIEGCPGQSQFKSLGNHDFAYGSEHKYSYVSTYEVR
jgi:hypothetical protein